MDSRNIYVPDFKLSRNDWKPEMQKFADINNQIESWGTSNNESINITHRSSLGLLPANVFADLSNVNGGTSFAYNKLPELTKYQFESKDDVSILREVKQDTTFKMPLPKITLQTAADMSTMSPKNLSMKYLRPLNSDNQQCSPSSAPSSPSIGWVEDRIASFAAKNSSSNDITTKEVDWSNVFERIAEQKDNPVTSIAGHRFGDNVLSSVHERHHAMVGNTKEVDEKSFSIEALSISMANRPRSTSFGGSPHEARNEIANTRNEGFSDYTNPPGSNFGSIAIYNTNAHSKIKDISYLEDSVFTDNPLTDRMEPNKDGQFSLGPFPSQSDIPDDEFEANPSVSNNIDFIDQAEKEFQKEHKFDQFDISNVKDASKPKCDKEFSTNLSASLHGIDNEDNDNRLSASAYFAMSTSRLGSLEKVPAADPNSSHTANKQINNEEGRPNLGFSRIVSPKRKPVAVISLSNEENSLNRKSLFDTDMQKSNYTNQTTSSSNSTKYSNSRDSQRSSFATDRTFKIPMPPKIDNRKETQTLPRTSKNTSRNRHSSPIKREQLPMKENIAPNIENNLIDLSEKHVVKSDENGPSEMNSKTIIESINVPFPVEIDKPCLSWLSVEMNKTEDKVASLRNLTNKTLELRLIIRDSNCFTFKKDKIVHQSPYLACESSISSQMSNDNVIDAVLQGNETKDVVIQFTPTSSSARQIKGKLVIKPRGMGGKTLKASVPLCGYVGSPKIEFDDSFKATVGHIPNHITTFIGTISGNTETTKDTLIYNRGDLPAFVRIQPFADMNCRVACGNEPTDPIRVEPNAFILNPGSSRKITICALPGHGIIDGHHTVVGSLLIISGPELCRQVLKHKKIFSKNFQINQKHLVRGVDFDVPFQGENEMMTNAGALVDYFSGDEESDFELKITATSINVVGLKSKTQFVRLQVEDTLSESRINCTVLGGNPFDSVGEKATRQVVRNYDTIREEEEIEIPPKNNYNASNLNDKPDSGSKKLPIPENKTPCKNSIPELIKLKSTKLFFPPVKVGNTGVEKLIIENREKRNISIAIHSITSPFKTNHSEFSIKPRSFLKVPIVYSPDDVGKHRGKVILQSNCGKLLEAALIGDSLK